MSAPPEGAGRSGPGVPRSTYFPAAMAFGITLLMAGIVTSLLVVGAGALLIGVALAGWIGEMRHEQ